MSPRLGFAYDISGRQSLVARGGFGMFYDRPQGNQVFDLITNPPGLQSTAIQWGLAKDISPTGALYAPVGLNPNVYEWKTPVVYQWNIGVQWKMPAEFVLDVSYVGSESRDLLQQRQINALPYGTAYLASSQDPTRGQTCTGCSASSTLPGGNALPTDLLRSAYPGYSAVRMWEFSAYANYKALQTTISRRFYKGLMFSANYTASSAKGIAGGDWDGARIDGKDREANYGPLAQDRPHAFVINFVYQVPRMADGALGYLTNDWQFSGVYRWMSGAPVRRRLLDRRRRRDQPYRFRPGRSHRPERRPGSGIERRPVQAVQHLGLQRAELRQQRPRVAAGVHEPAASQQLRPVGVEVGPARRPPPVRDPARRVQRVQHRAVLEHQHDGELRERRQHRDHQPAVRLDGQTGQPERIRVSISGVRPPRQLQLMMRFSF